MNDSPNDVDTRRYFQTCFGDAQGWLCMAVGLKPYRDEKDKYQHGRWSEVAFRWPQEVDNAHLHREIRSARRRVRLPVSDAGAAPAERQCGAACSGPRRRRPGSRR